MIRKIKTPYGKVTVYQNGPGKGKHVIVIPGFSESITHNRELVDRLAGQGYDAFTFSQPRRGTFVDPIARQQAIVLELFKALLPADQKVYAVAHSLGVAAALKAARLHPDKFTGLLLMQPSGIGERQTLLRLIRRVGKKTAKNHKNVASTAGSAVYSVTIRQVLRAHATSTAYLIRNPLLALKEASAAVHYRIAEDIIEVQKLGIAVHIVLVRNDELFTMGDALEYDNVLKLPGAYSTLTHKEARHDTFWMHPEQTAELVDGFIKQT